MRKAVSIVAAALMFAGLACGQGSPGAPTTSPADAGKPSASPGDEGKRPVLLLLHPGSFWLGNASTMQPAAAIAARYGFRPILAEYPLEDLSRAVRWTKRQARKYHRRGRDVYAYGESSGGTLAALLADDDLVGAAATYSPLPDLISYMESLPRPTYYAHLIAASRAMMRRYSPIRYQAERPILAAVGATDYPVIKSSVNRWAERDEGVRTIELDGGHVGGQGGRFGEVGSPEQYDSNVAKLMRWLARQSARAGSG